MILRPPVKPCSPSPQFRPGSSRGAAPSPRRAGPRPASWSTAVRRSVGATTGSAPHGGQLLLTLVDAVVSASRLASPTSALRAVCTAASAISSPNTAVTAAAPRSGSQRGRWCAAGGPPPGRVDVVLVDRLPGDQGQQWHRHPVRHCGPPRSLVVGSVATGPLMRRKTSRAGRSRGSVVARSLRTCQA